MAFGTKIREIMEAVMDSPEDKLKREFHEILVVVHERWLRASEEMRGMFGASYEIDEMALYFPDPHLVFEFASRAVQQGWQMFNSAEDVVETSPIPSDYEVRYWFLRHGDYSYRLELMNVGEGFSPYHGALHNVMRRFSRPCGLAHASFKVPNEKQYAAAVVGLGNAGYSLAQHCSSSYGRFSYYLRDDEGWMTAIKPRINLRDADDA